MNQITRRHLFVAAAIAALGLPVAASPRAAAPRNIIVLIGDGMGLAQVTLARLSLGRSDASLAMDSMRYAGLVKTHPADTDTGRGIITDSAAASTAIATGHKTRNGMLGMLPNGTPVRSILEAAQSAGKGTGLVTTTAITDATPAGFAAHVPSRASHPEIAAQYLERKVDVLMGGGEAFFLPQTVDGSRRKDDRDLLSAARQAGYAVVRTPQELQGVRRGRVLGLFAKGNLECKPPEPSLAEMTSKALEILGSNPRGFFLMVEGGQIDFAGHANDAPNNVKQTLDFDAAVAAVLQFARRRGDTLVILTADHETGGMAIVGPPSGSTAEYSIEWGTRGHSATMVPLLAEGPGAERFSGVLDNTDIARRIAGLWKLRLE